VNMESLLDRLSFAPLHDQAARALLGAALVQFYGFTLVLIRLSGLMIVGPIFGQPLVPPSLRVMLVLTMAFVITPTLANHGRIVFDKLDANHDGVVTRNEVPDSLVERYEKLREAAGVAAADGLTAADFRMTLLPPRTILEYAWTGVGEFGLGFVMGLGVLTILSGLQIAGQIIDQQTGLSLGEIANPGLNITGSVTGQFLFLFATTVLLVMQPTGYHLTMLSALVETFRSIPLGEAFVTAQAVDLLRDLVHQSLVLGIQVAAPLLAAMSLVALTMGFLGHSVPQINVLVVGFPVRALMSLTVLMASLSGVARLVVDVVPRVIDALHHALAG
jgi:flagellar biosynthesis protein FliR